jgi:hypothetical protein
MLTYAYADVCIEAVESQKVSRMLTSAYADDC